MDPCTVCGSRDMNLVDGFYYCVECGTQDVNVRETVVEKTILGDGTFAHTTSKKFTVVKDGIEMSGEWHKWHIFNFIMVGLTDELIALGAKPSLKMKVLWIWMRYVKQFQVKDDLKSKTMLDMEDENESPKLDDNNENEDSSDNDSNHELRNRKSSKSKTDKIIKDIKNITKGTLLSILYVALNLDRSDIQLSHLLRFIREGRLSLYDCMKFVPKELKLKAVNHWKSFSQTQREYNPVSIREISLTCFKILKLGVPLVPDLRKLVGNLVQELYLPKDIKDLAFALMHFMPIDFLNIDAKTQKSIVRIPDYECICMAYILIALKICFGLDDDYEVRISKMVNKINDEENYLRSYKLGLFSEPCDRLFSFNEWCQHLQFRKHNLCKNYLPMSKHFNKQTDDYTFMAHLEKRRKRKVKLSDDVTMDILSKIRSDAQLQIIPKDDFPVTLTPMSTYIDIIATHAQDPDLRLLLCEDFTNYSLKYAIQDLILPRHITDLGNPIIGVSESGKSFNKHVIGTLKMQEGDMTMVYVRNCQNKNWLKTEPPKIHHVTKIRLNECVSDKDSDHGYDSNNENSNPESNASHVTITDESVCKDDKLLEIFDDLDVKSIFDDNFTDINVRLSNKVHDTFKEDQVNNFFEIDTRNNLHLEDSKAESINNIQHNNERHESVQFDQNMYDRDKMIKNLIELACEKYKISIPKENVPKRQYKRKSNLADGEASSSEPKKKRSIDSLKPGEAKRDVDKFIYAYYNSLHNDILHEVSKQVKSIIEDVGANNLQLEQSGLNESCVVDMPNDTINTHESNLEGGANDKSQIDINCSIIENSETGIDSEGKSRDNVTAEESIEDEFLDEMFPKSDPKFDEKEHDIRQLYVRLEENLDSDNVSILDISNDPEIDKIINKQIDQFSNIDQNALYNNEYRNKIDELESSSDSDDDVPLRSLKEMQCFEKKRVEQKKEKLESLINDLCNLKEFKYWVRHYKSSYVVKSRDVGKKFDLELIENLPVSFVFVIRECAAIIGCSMFSLYKNMQNIEEILIANG